MKWKSISIVLFFLSFLWDVNTNQIIAKNIKTKRCLENREPDSSPSTISVCMDQAWNVSWVRFFNEGTKQFYDYLSSYKEGHELNHLPTGDEVNRQYPNYQGYDTGMEDCMISAGVMLCMIIDKYMVTKDEKLKYVR